MTGTKKYKELETEKRKGKRRFLERQIEDNEAEKEIKEYDYNDPRSEHENHPQVHRT